MDKSTYLSQMGNRIRVRREEIGMTQEELATKVGYKSRTSINKIELGKTDIGQMIIISIAEALNVPTRFITDANISISDQPFVRKLEISPEAQKIAKAYDKATSKEQHMVRLTLSEYLDDEEEYQYAAARGNSRVKIPVQDDDDDLPKNDTIIDGL